MSASMASISFWLFGAGAGGGTTTGRGGASAGVAGFAPSSSAMIRRIEARISSIEGSCALTAWFMTFVPARCAAQSGAPGVPGANRRDSHLYARAVAGWQSEYQRRRQRIVDDIGLAAVRVAHAGPAIADLVVMDAGVVSRHAQAENLRRQAADRRQQRVRRNDPVALGADQRDARIHQFLLRVENIEGGALSHPRLLAHAVERDLGGLHLRLRRLNVRFGRIEQPP